MQEFFTTEEVCKSLKIGRRVLYNEMKEGHLVGIRVGKGFRFSKEAVDSFISNRTVTVEELMRHPEEESEAEGDA